MNNDDELFKFAWQFRERAYPHKSGTKVGCAIETDKGRLIGGWNIEGLWMTSIHAEVCAISKLELPTEKIEKIVIVAETSFFTPCGACLDWIVQFGTDNCCVFIQTQNREIHKYKLKELIPFYPRH